MKSTIENGQSLPPIRPVSRSQLARIFAVISLGGLGCASSDVGTLGTGLDAGNQDADGSTSISDSTDSPMPRYCFIIGKESFRSGSSDKGADGVLRLGNNADSTTAHMLLVTHGSDGVPPDYINACEEIIAARSDITHSTRIPSGGTLPIHTYENLPFVATVRVPGQRSRDISGDSTYLGRGHFDNGRIAVNFDPTRAGLVGYEGVVEMSFIFPQPAPRNDETFLYTNIRTIYADLRSPRFTITTTPMVAAPRWEGNTIVVEADASEGGYWGAEVRDPRGNIVTTQGAVGCRFYNQYTGGENACAEVRNSICTLGISGSTCRPEGEGGQVGAGHNTLRISTANGTALPSGEYSVSIIMRDNVGNPVADNQVQQTTATRR